MIFFDFAESNKVVRALLAHNLDLIKNRDELQSELDEANEKIDRFKAAVKEMKAKAGIRGPGRPRKVQP